MIEALWSCLLVLACLNRATRPLALLLAAKAVLNYGAAWAGFWTAPALIDAAFGTAGVLMAMRLPPRIGAVLIAGFVLTPLVHAAHWGLWLNGVHAGVQYYAAVLVIYTAQVSALAFPEARDNVRAFLRNSRVARRRALADHARHARRQGSKGD